MSDLLKNLTKIYVAQISSAMIISEILTDHSNETKMTPDLLIACLVYRLMTPMTTEEINDNLDIVYFGSSLQYIENYEQIINNFLNYIVNIDIYLN